MKIEQTSVQNAALSNSQSQNVIQKTQTTKKGNEGADIPNIIISQMSKTERNALSLSEQFLINSIEKANKAVLGANTRFEFSIHDKTKEIIVKVLNADTGDIIREIPSEKVLDMVASIWQAVGLFVDEKR